MSSRPEFCAVCGEPAIGFHYDVASCSGCRSFFRRTIKQEKVYVCKRDEQCMQRREVDRVNCKACRLDACIEAGMNPQALQSSDINIPTNQLAQSIVQRQTAKREAAVALVRPSPSLSVEQRMQGVIDELLLTKRAHDRLRTSIFSPTPTDGYNLEKALGESRKLGSPWGCMFDEENRELIMSRSPPVAIMEGRLKWWPLADMIYTTEYIRALPFFEAMSKRDQRVLVVHCNVTCCTLTRSFYSVEQHSEVTINPDGMRHNKKWETVIDLEFDCEAIMTFYRLGVTETEFALIKGIVCTDSHIVGLSREGAEVLDQYQTIYRKTLMSLALATRGAVEGPKFFSAIFMLLCTLAKVNLVKKLESKLLYPAYRNTPYECPIIEEILFEDTQV